MEKAMKHLSSDPYEALNSKKKQPKRCEENIPKTALKYHPDKNNTLDLFKVIQSAYDKLKDKPTPKKGQVFTNRLHHHLSNVSINHQAIMEKPKVGAAFTIIMQNTETRLTTSSKVGCPRKIL